MKIFTKILHGFYTLAGILLVFVLAMFWVKPELIGQFSNLAEKETLKIGIAAFVCILVSILWLVYWADYLVRTRSISFENPGGKVKISLRAIEEFIITKISSQIGNIHSMRVKSSLGSQGLETLITLKISGGYNIPELTAQIQELTKNYLQDVVGVERVSHIEISVTSITSNSETAYPVTEVESAPHENDQSA